VATAGQDTGVTGEKGTVTNGRLIANGTADTAAASTLVIVTQVKGQLALDAARAGIR
jgi:hypothetical protein